MLNFGGWQIQREVLELVSESIARENLVLPLEYSEGTLTLLSVDRGADQHDLVSKLQFILTKDIVCQFTDAETVRIAVDGFYYLGATFVTSCRTRAAEPCSTCWLELTETPNPDERNCDECDQIVHLCRNEEDAGHHAEMGNCVALRPYDPDFDDPNCTLSAWCDIASPNSPEDWKWIDQFHPYRADFLRRLQRDSNP